MDYKSYLEDELGVKLSEDGYTKRKYLNYLESLKEHENVIIPDEYALQQIDADEPGILMEYAISKCGGDSSDISSEDLDLLIERITNGYRLIKYIEEVKTRE